MANPYQQKALQRKLIYLGLILVLFSVSLLHRELVVKPQATDLQLREITRGEAELTGSAVRLVLTGSRGLAVPILWSAAIHAQERHQWNELELIVRSITKLQPYFVAPWLFQSWNLSFNVAVECDRPRDKYYFISRGIELLSEGERRNQGSGDEYGAADPNRKHFPGNPELRHNIGFTYQLKIGNSDEKNTMRSLLDLSCIDPIKREPADFWTSTETSQRQVDPKKFDAFCQENPRLIRRLREQLHYDTRAKIVAFLEENRDVPSRFAPGGGTTVGVSKLKDPQRQFPVLPPPLSPRWPDPLKPDLGLNTLGSDGLGETLDVFLVARTWYQYAQKPLPPSNRDPGVREVYFDPLEYRLPKALALQIFRGYPARAQVFMAENLEAEGWFDDDGWAIPSWNDSRRGLDDSQTLVVGRDTKFHAQPAWRAGYEAYRDYGIDNGLYLSPSETQELERKAQVFRTKVNVKPGERFTLRSDQRQGEMGESFDAHMKLYWNGHYRGMTNYDDHINQAEAEKDPLTVYTRKLLYEAERERRFARAPEKALVLYEQAWPLWTYICLKYPRFSQIQVLQEDIFEMEMWYVRLAQTQREQFFRKVFLGFAQMNAWPHPSWEELLDSSRITHILPVRNVRGPMDGVQYYSANPGLRPALQAVLAGANTYHGAAFVPPLLDPLQQQLLLTRYLSRDPQAPDQYKTVPANWKALVDAATVDGVRKRLRMDR